MRITSSVILLTVFFISSCKLEKAGGPTAEMPREYEVTTLDPGNRNDSSGLSGDN